MKLMPDSFYGVVEARVPKVNVAIGLLGVPLTFGAQIAGWGLVVAVGIGCLSVMPLGVALQWLGYWRFRRRFRNLPVSSVAQRSPDGLSWVALVTKLDGTIVSVELPADYDPREDGGRRLMAEVAPELVELVFDDEDE